MDRLTYAKEQAENFNHEVLTKIRLALQSHSTGVVQFAMHMQARVDAAEQLLADVAACKRGAPRTGDDPKKSALRSVFIPVELIDRVDALVDEAKKRTP